jgi:alcohol dehydrogenase
MEKQIFFSFKRTFMENIHELRKFVSPEFIFGKGAHNMAARYAANFGASKVLIVTDPGVIAAGWTKEVTNGLDASQIPCHVFSAVTPNPKAEEVMAGAEEYAREQCDVIIAVGGGSPIDCAKGIGIISSNGGHIKDYEGVDQVPTPGPPIICVPTTAGSSADVSQFAIITDADKRVKLTLISKTLVPDVSLIDPLTLTTKPRDLTAHTGIDAIAHAFEAYVSNAASPVTDLFALEAVRLISANLIQAIENPNDLAARSGTMLGSLYAGLAFSNAGLGLVHAMAHSLGGYLDTPHGESNSILIYPVIEFNFNSAQEKYAALGKALGVHMNGMTSDEKKHALIQSLETLKKTLKADLSLAGIGVKSSDIPELAAQALQDPCVVTNPRRPTQKEIELIYEQAL